MCEHASAKKSCLFLFTVTIGHDLKFKILSPLDTPTLPALSVDIKRGIVDLRRGGLAIRDVATQMKVFVGSVCKTLHTYEGCGKYLNPTKKMGRPQILLDDDDARYLKSLLEPNPTSYPDEIKEKLKSVRNASVSMAMISRFLRSRDFTWKMISRRVLEGDDMVRACREVEMAQYNNPDYFVFIDESHIGQILPNAIMVGHQLDQHWSNDLYYGRYPVCRRHVICDITSVSVSPEISGG